MQKNQTQPSIFIIDYIFTLSTHQIIIKLTNREMSININYALDIGKVIMERQGKSTFHNMARTIDRQQRTVRRLNRGLSSVHETTQLLTGPMNLQHVLEMVVQTVADALGTEASGLRLLDEETKALTLMATYGLSEAYKYKGPVSAGESELNQRVLGGEAVAVNDMRTNPFFKRYHSEIVQEGLISCLSIGLIYKGHGIGMLRLYSKRPRRFSNDDISLARTIASQSAAAIVNARLYKEALEKERMARQLKLAGVVQRHLIPESVPNIPGVDLAGIYVPCYEVGGDFYDFIATSENRFVFVIGDVMGKGIPASLAMASVRSSLRAYAEKIESVEEIVYHVNRMICNDVEWGEFVTLFCAVLDTSSGKLTYCNCGHEPPVLIRNDQIFDLQEGGAVLGISKHPSFESRQITMEPNSMLVMYTDGLADAMNFDRESFGRQRIIHAIKDSIGLTAEQAARNILWFMRKFTGLTKRFDDTALVVLKRTEIK